MKTKASKSDISLKAVTHFFSRFHTIIFFVLVSVGMAAAMLMLISIVQLSSTSAPSASNPVNGNFDQVTIDKINELGEVPPTPSSTMRTSPFVE